MSSSDDRDGRVAVIGACLKWVDARPDVDRLTGAVHTDARTSGPSDADQAALEWALRIGELWHDEVVAVTAGTDVVEPMLRDALSAGAARAVRVDLDNDAPSEHVALGLAGALTRASLVLCGVWSLDRGSGSVPAFVAAELGAAQVLGVIGLETPADGERVIRAERRLDRGRRERVQAPLPVVVSVEGGSARLRRAPLARVLAARDAVIDVIDPPGFARPPLPPVHHVAPFRPRPRVLPSPSTQLSARERILALSGALTDREPPRVVRLDPTAAADELLAQLHAWGYR